MALSEEKKKRLRHAKQLIKESSIIEGISTCRVKDCPWVKAKEACKFPIPYKYSLTTLSALIDSLKRCKCTFTARDIIGSVTRLRKILPKITFARELGLGAKEEK